MAFQGDTRATFVIGDAYPADDPVARWLTALAISHNDIRHGMLLLMEPEQPAHEALYYFRLIASHFKEIAEDLRDAYENWPEIQTFIDELPTEGRTDLDAVLAAASTLEVQLGKLRNTLFHYPELDRRKAAKGREKLQEAMRDAATIKSGITSGPKFGDARFDYADEVVVQFIGENDVAEPLMTAVQEATFAFWRLCHHAHGTWLSARACVFEVETLHS